MKYRLLLATALLVMFSAASSPGAGAFGGITKAPDDPEFLRYQADRLAAATRGRGFPIPGGEIPRPVSLNHLTPAAGEFSDKIFDPFFSLVDLGLVPPVRDRGRYRTSWAFSAVGSLETTVMGKGEELDLSEYHLILEHGFDQTPNGGGNAWMTTAYLTRWSGPLQERQFPYVPDWWPLLPSSAQPDAPPSILADEVIFLPEFPAPGDLAVIDAIKGQVESGTGVYISLGWHDGCWSPVDDSLYCSDPGLSRNIAAVIVGWDDDFSVSSFVELPPGDGAFLVRDSLGETWAGDGYFWLSYYDVLAQPRAAFSGAEPTTAYGSLYDFDPLGWVGSIGLGTTTAWAANVFTAGRSEMVSAVGLYAVDTGTDVTISVYTDVAAGDPVSGVLQGVQAASFTEAGYYTVPLDLPVPIAAGQRFSVVVEFTTSTYPYPVAYEYALPGYSSSATSGPGQSFVSPDGIEWADIVTFDPANYPSSPTANVCLKAYAVDGPDIAVRLKNFPIEDGATFEAGTLSWSAVAGRSVAFWIENFGENDLLLTGVPAVQLGGADAAHFQVLLQPPTDPIPPGGAALFRLATVYDGPPYGEDRRYSFTVTIPNNDPDEGNYTFTLEVSFTSGQTAP